MNLSAETSPGVLAAAEAAAEIFAGYERFTGDLLTTKRERTLERWGLYLVFGLVGESGLFAGWRGPWWASGLILKDIHDASGFEPWGLGRIGLRMRVAMAMRDAMARAGAA